MRLGLIDQAVRTVHLNKGFFNTDGGYEFNLLLGAAAFALADTGPGPWSLDRAFGWKRHGPAWAFGALAAGLAGPRLVERFAPQPEPPAEPPRFMRDTETRPASVNA